MVEPLDPERTSCTFAQDSDVSSVLKGVSSASLEADVGRTTRGTAALKQPRAP